MLLRSCGHELIHLELRSGVQRPWASMGMGAATLPGVRQAMASMGTGAAPNQRQGEDRGRRQSLALHLEGTLLGRAAA